MEKNKIAEFLMVLKTFFPKFFTTLSVAEIENTMKAWNLILGDYSNEQIQAGLKFFLITNTKGFPPTPGEMIEAISKVSSPADNTLTAEECWLKIQKAAKNSTYNSVEEFNNLPDICKKLVGSSCILQRYADMSTEELETVVKSNFLKSYQALSIKEKEAEKMKLIGTQQNSNLLED